MRRITRRFLIGLGIILAITWIYTNSLIGVAPQTKAYYKSLKTELRSRGYKANMFAISGKRFQPDNWLLTTFGGASANSRHKKGEAIDIIVLDVNDDGEADAMDVGIVYEILDKQIVKGDGGLGTYKKEKGFFNRQMVHFDCGGKGARWRR